MLAAHLAASLLVKYCLWRAHVTVVTLSFFPMILLQEVFGRAIICERSSTCSPAELRAFTVLVWFDFDTSPLCCIINDHRSGRSKEKNTSSRSPWSDGVYLTMQWSVAGGSSLCYLGQYV